MKLNGWKRLFLVYAVAAALGSYVLAFEKVRDLRIAQQNEIYNFKVSDDADAINSQCYPPNKEPLCRHDMSYKTKSILKSLEGYKDELEYAFPKYFLTCFGLSTLICYFLFQTFMFVRRGFLSKDSD